MAGKRIASSELNHLNWDKEEEPETAGSFKVAPEEELKKRVIKKARRSIDPETKTENISIFSSFEGFKKSSASSPFSFLSKEKTNQESSAESKTINELDKNKDDNDKDEDEYNVLKNLNSQFVKWIAGILNKNTKINLTTYLNQYEKCLENILTEKQIKDVTKENEEIFEFNEELNDNQNQSTNGNEEEKDKPPPNSKERLNVFSTFKFPALSFGNNNNNVSTSEGSSGPLFNFQDFKSSNFGNVNVKIDTDVEPPKPEFKAVIEEGSVYTKRCKVFIKVNKVDNSNDKDKSEYTDRGIGKLYLKPIKDTEKVQLIVRADTNLGNILLNFILNENLPCQRMGKNNVMIICIPTPESKQEPTTVLIRVKTEEEADELLENINKHKN